MTGVDGRASVTGVEGRASVISAGGTGVGVAFVLISMDTFGIAEEPVLMGRVSGAGGSAAAGASPGPSVDASGTGAASVTSALSRDVGAPGAGAGAGTARVAFASVGGVGRSARPAAMRAASDAARRGAGADA